MKIYAKQIAPECQESPLFLDGFFPDNIAVCGNRDYKERCPELFKIVKAVLNDGEFDPENDSPLNINGCSIYCTEWSENEIKQEIASSFGGSPKDVVLYAFEGWRKTPVYKQAV